jgi:flavin-dependent dehydrogenase
MNLFKQLVIIGGGPAGVAAALSALNQGIEDVTVIEKEPFDRHRIGEILLTQTILELKELGIADEVSVFAEKYQWGKKYAAAYVHGSDRTPWKVQNNHPLASTEDQPHIPRSFVNKETGLWYTLMVRRHEFDEALREIAANKGVKFIHGSVKDMHITLEQNKDKSVISSLDVETLDGKTLKIFPQFIIDATGQQAFIPRKLNQRNVLDDWGLQARYSYFEGVDFNNAKENGLFENGANILSYEDGWVWVANLGRGLTSAGVVSRHWDKDKNTFWNKFKNLPEYKTFGFDKAVVRDFKGNEVDSQDHCYAHPNYRFRSDVMRGKNWACCGDAAMFLDPLLSQGVTLAITFGKQLGKIASIIIQEEIDSVEILKTYELSYISELEVLNKVVSQWYQPDFSFANNWSGAAKKISKIFGRDIGTDVESFRWISNLENIHHIMKDRNDINFLNLLNEVNQIKMIHDFEKYGILKI